MRQKIKFSVYSLLVTAVVLILFVVGIFSLHGNVEKLILFCIIMGITIIVGLYYCPKSIEANEYGIVLHRLLSSSKVFPYNAIDIVDICCLSMGGLRLCANGGFFGYWGYFHDVLIGSYFGYYGNRSNCILVKMKDCKQYVLGCDDAHELVSYINSHLNRYQSTKGSQK